MYAKTAQFYDVLYSSKDYAREAQQIEKLIVAHHPSAAYVLDVACGTGEHARFLSQRFSVDGIDLQPEFISLAAGKVKSGRFTVADMRTFSLPRKYDVVQCLFSSIGYMTHPEDVIAALRCFRDHLNPNGLVLVEPWLTPETFHSGKPYMAPPVDRPDLKIVRMNVSERDGNISRLRFHYLIASREGIEYVEEDHVLALYSVEEMKSFFKEAGLSATYDPEGLLGRGLYVATIGD